MELWYAQMCTAVSNIKDLTRLIKNNDHETIVKLHRAEQQYNKNMEQVKERIAAINARYRADVELHRAVYEKHFAALHDGKASYEMDLARCDSQRDNTIKYNIHMREEVKSHIVMEFLHYIQQFGWVGEVTSKDDGEYEIYSLTCTASSTTLEEIPKVVPPMSDGLQKMLSSWLNREIAKVQLYKLAVDERYARDVAHLMAAARY